MSCPFEHLRRYVINPDFGPRMTEAQVLPKQYYNVL